ncbi:hypothetical protein DSO57_1019035 [Entomophthora muscae]|uniref:Uncharacterized protein n=1 Tax=Entomophthora muscae TaxID=34485 RepID=A0ACC2SGV4_9FUNG|nr:hypothetical protein DSO57_1019035 [Entomophthora muscae]
MPTLLPSAIITLMRWLRFGLLSLLLIPPSTSLGPAHTGQHQLACFGHIQGINAGICIFTWLLPHATSCGTPKKLSAWLRQLLPGIRIDNSFTLEIQAQGQDLNPDHEFLQTAGPGDQGAACPHFPGVKPLQAEANNHGPNDESSQNKGTIAPNEGVIKAPNGGNKITAISFMSLKSKLVSNQEPSLEEGTGLWPGPMTTTLEQDNQVANLRSLTNERTPSLGAILPPWNPSTQIPGPNFPNALINPHGKY